MGSPSTKRQQEILDRLAELRMVIILFFYVYQIIIIIKDTFFAGSTPLLPLKMPISYNGSFVVEST